MIDAKKVNLLIFLIFIILIFAPPYVNSGILVIQLIAITIICYLRLAASFTIRKPLKDVADKTEPFVSVIITCANEPAALLELTLNQMAKIDYQNFEVLVLDNNNENKTNWLAIKKICTQLGNRFRFLHVDHVDGYKAGALNLANQHVAKKSEIIAIVDADYLVRDDFLSEMVIYFENPKVAIVQAPQDYCNQDQNPGLYANYRSFFSAYMTQAQHLDTVTFTGTMGMIRRSLFDEGLKWNEWCITEDTEAGIFIHALGYRGVYLDEPYGQGLMPFSYNSLIKQRSRWSYGNMQIIRKNLKPILASKDFTTSQKLGFLTQLVAWIRFDLTLLLMLIISAIANLINPNIINATNVYIIIATLAILFAVELIFFIFSLNRSLPLSSRFKAVLVQYGLLFTMSYSWVYMLLRGRLGFNVTSKTKSKQSWLKLFFSQELILPLLIILALLLMRGSFGRWWLLALSLLLIIELSGIIHLSNRFRRLA